MQRKFRLALIGAGMITESSHLPAALALSDIEVAAIVDPVPNRAAALARKFGIAPRVGMLVDEIRNDIDGAIVATPNHTHRDIAIAFLDAGVSVLVEKPLASTYEDGLAVAAAAERSGKTVAVGFCTRFRANTILLKELLDKDFFGVVSRFYHQYGTPGGWAPMSGYILNRRSAGGGVLVVTGTHFIDRMLHFWGYPEEAQLADDGTGGPEANAIASVRYARRGTTLRGKLRYSKTTPLPGGLVLDTEAGIVTLRDTDEAEIVLHPAAHPDLAEIIRPAKGSAAPQDVFIAQLEDFIRACRGRGEAKVTAHQALQSLRLVEDLYRARRPLIDRWHGVHAEATWANA